MKEDQFEASRTVVEAVDRTEAILRGGAIQVRPAPTPEPTGPRSSILLRLDRWWARFTAWRFGATDPDL